MDLKTWKALIAELVGTFALIYIGVCAIANFHGVSGGLLGIALAHGLAIAVMVSATGAISGGHLNPAVTVGAWVADRIECKTAIAYILAQLTGSLMAALCAYLSFSGLYLYDHNIGGDIVANGTPALGSGTGPLRGMLIEAILTFFLVFVVFGTGIDSRGPKIGGLAIGLTVTMDILAGGPLTGAAMNPARFFGPSVAAERWDNWIVYWVGPLVGGIVAGVVYGQSLLKEEPKGK